MDKIPLSNLIVELRRQLEEAQRQGQDQDIRFQIEDVELELQVTSSLEGGAKAGFKLWVIDAEATGKAVEQSVQKIKFKLKPMDTEGRPIDVSDDDTI